MSATNRHFYRCRACCHTVAVEGLLETEQTSNGATVPKARCVCEGRLEYIGRVGRKPGLWRDSERCACDARCTNAPGPQCDCSCGGVNHGTKRVVPVEVAAGGVPRLKVECAADCIARAAEYAAAAEPFRARLRAMREARAERGTWRVSHEEQALADALSKIAALRTHKGRLKALAELS